ncbi:VMAP-C domain-containing protein [Parafrankia discariae]|uniref:VMAP-C domain-containing protein n=1 Tax=Parafrankia discariae TaxID=365528 RepID=UPI00037342F6|nr:hypothetical protein [Parafrankia discariae]
MTGEVDSRPRAPRAVRLSRLRSAAERQIIDILDDCPDLHPTDSRLLLLRRCSAWSGRRLGVADLPQSRQWFVDLVGRIGREGDFEGLVQAVADLTRDDVLTARLRRLADEWQAADVAADAPEGLWEELRHELSMVPATEVADVLHHVTQGRHSGFDSTHCATAWDLLVYLADRSAAPDRLRPHVEFLEHLVDHIDQRVARRMEAWHRAAAGTWQATAALRSLQLGRAGHPDRSDRRRQAVLTLQLEQTGTRDDLYRLRWWHQWDRSDDVFHPGPPDVVARPELERAVEAAVGLFERSLAGRGVEAVIEVILPFGLLGLRVESFLLDSGSGLPAPLALRYPVVLRSLDRMRQPGWHRVWRLRWQVLTEEPDRARVVRCEPAGAGPHHLEALLVTDEGAVAVVLDSGPDAYHPAPRHEQLLVALRCGIPGILWSYSADVGDAAADIHKFAGAQNVGSLPERVASARRSAFIESTQGNHLGGYLALLWDDPDRQPERGLAGSPGRPAKGDYRD